MACDAWTTCSKVERRAGAPRPIQREDGPADDGGFEADLGLLDELDAAPLAPAYADDAEGPLDALDDDALFDVFSEDRSRPGADDDALGPEGLEGEDALFDLGLDDELGPALDDDAEGPLQDDDADLTLPDQEESLARGLGGDEEGSVDEAAFDLEELPPLEAGFDDEALFDEALDDLELDLELPRAAPAPARVPPPVADRSPPSGAAHST
jgi:hypothetical protein